MPLKPEINTISVVFVCINVQNPLWTFVEIIIVTHDINRRRLLIYTEEIMNWKKYQIVHGVAKMGACTGLLVNQ